MKKHSRILIAVVAAALLVAALTLAAAAAGTTGSDLPVSESYVLRALENLEEKLTRKISAVSQTQSGSGGNQAAGTASVSFTVVYLNKGQTITGVCEIIPRSGTSSARCPGVNGISDLTSGEDLTDGTAFTLNHLLLIPRDDGRGVTVTSKEAYFMVRGDYRIEEN